MPRTTKKKKFDKTQPKLNAYRNMWIIVMYDLPTETAQNRKDAATFRKKMLKLGFSMFQFSVYIKHEISMEAVETTKNKLKKIQPPEGKLGIFFFTDKQFGKTEIIFCQKKQKAPKKPAQLELF
ncbi:MAG: CRISPR-associated endonuclease Cas2 [Bacteroidia bacterium]|nr:CRISPR-associated endonuclease Cas2 [Bacteroidia bacterium]